MAIDNFIPKIWSANLLQAKDNVHVFAALASRDYEGDITGQGDSVQISQIGAIDVSAYTKNSTSLTFQELEDAASTLLIDQANYFAFKIDDVDKAQSKPKVMQEAMRKAAYQLSETQDDYIAALYATAGLAQNTNASPVDMTSLNVEEEFLSVAEQLDEANASRQGRFSVIPPWVQSKLVLAGVSSLTDNVSEWKNGLVARAFGFDYYLSNNVSNAGSWAKTRMICGVMNESITVAEQVMSVEALRPESSFSDAVKGLHVYGAKIMRPDVTCTLYADYTAEA